MLQGSPVRSDRFRDTMRYLIENKYIEALPAEDQKGVVGVVQHVTDDNLVYACARLTDKGYAAHGAAYDRFLDLELFGGDVKPRLAFATIDRSRSLAEILEERAPPQDDETIAYQAQPTVAPYPPFRDPSGLPPHPERRNMWMPLWGIVNEARNFLDGIPSYTNPHTWDILAGDEFKVRAGTAAFVAWQGGWIGAIGATLWHFLSS